MSFRKNRTRSAEQRVAQCRKPYSDVLVIGVADEVGRGQKLLASGRAQFFGLPSGRRQKNEPPVVFPLTHHKVDVVGNLVVLLVRVYLVLDANVDARAGLTSAL